MTDANNEGRPLWDVPLAAFSDTDLVKELAGRVRSRGIALDDTELVAVLVDRVNTDDLAEAIKRRCAGNTDLYELFDLMSPEGMSVADFTTDEIVEAAEAAGMIYEDAAETVFMDDVLRNQTLENALERETFLVETDLMRHLERIEEAMTAGDADKAARLLDRFMRPGHRSRFRVQPRGEAA